MVIANQLSMDKNNLDVFMNTVSGSSFAGNFCGRDFPSIFVVKLLSLFSSETFIHQNLPHILLITFHSWLAKGPYLLKKYLHQKIGVDMLVKIEDHFLNKQNLG